MATPLVRGSVDGVRIGRIENDVGDPGVLRYVENSLPTLSTIDGLIEPPVSTASPKGALGSSIHHVRASGIHKDVPDVLRVFEPHMPEGGASIHTFIDAVPISGAPLGR